MEISELDFTPCDLDNNDCTKDYCMSGICQAGPDLCLTTGTDWLLPWTVQLLQFLFDCQSKSNKFSN